MSGLNPYAAALPSAPPQPQAPANPYAAAIATPAPAATRNPYASALHAPKALDKVRDTLGSLKRGYFDLAAEPMKAVDAVLGAPQRFIAGALASDTRNHNVDPGAEFRTGAYAAFHPSDSAKIEEDAGAAVHLDRLKTKDPRFRGKVQNFAADLGFQTLTDPLTYAGPGLARVGLKVAAPAALAAGRAVARKAPSLAKGVERTVNYVRPKAHVELDPLVNREGRNLVLGAKESEASVEARQAMADDALLKAEKENLQKGVISPRLRQRLLRERFVHGTSEVRQKALDAGYVPATGEAEKAPTGLYHTFLENYEPKQAVYDGVKMEQLGFGKHQPRHEPFAGFELPQGVDAEDLATLPDRMAARLKAGRGVTRHLMTDKRVREGLGMSVRTGSRGIADEGAFAEAQARQAKYVKDRPTMQKYLDEGKLRGEISGRLPFLKSISDVSRDVMFSDPSSFAHEGNISEAAFLSGGLGNAARGVGHYLNPRGVPQETLDAMEQAGAMSHFTRTAPPKWSPARLAGPLRDVKSRMLDRFDTSMRAADWKRAQAEIARERGPLPEAATRVADEAPIAPPKALGLRRVEADVTGTYEPEFQRYTNREGPVKRYEFHRGNEVVGHVEVSFPQGGVPHVEDLITHRQHRNQGLAKAMLADVTNDLTAKGYTKVTASPMNEAAAAINKRVWGDPEQRKSLVNASRLDDIGINDLHNIGARPPRLVTDDAARRLEEEARQYEAATRVRQNLGDYRNPSQFTEDLRGLGGRFPQWRLGIVPGMVGRAVAKNPQRIEQLTRAQEDANKDVWDPEGYSLDPGKPVNDMAKLTMNPVGYALGSSSSLGPLVDAVHAADNIRHPDSIDTGPKELAAMARGYIPFAQRLEDATGLGPYPSKAPPAVRTVAGMAGAYPTPPGGMSLKEREIRDIMQKMRVNRYVAEHVIYPRLFRH